MYSYGLAVPIAGQMDVLFHNPPPEYISQVNIPGISEAGATTHGRKSLPAGEHMAEITCSGYLAPISL